MRLRALVVVFALAALSARADEGRWTKFGRGSWIKVRTTTRLSSEEMVEVTTFTLAEVTAESYQLKIEASMGGNALPVEELRISRTAPGVPEWTWAETGSEELEVGGKPMVCAVRTGTGPDGKSTWKVWEGEIRGEKVEVRSEKSLVVQGVTRKETSKVTALDETVTVGQRTLACWVRSTRLEYDGQTVETTLWESGEMPGRTVKSESRATAGALPMTSVREVIEFETK